MLAFVYDDHHPVPLSGRSTGVVTDERAGERLARRRVPSGQHEDGTGFRGGVGQCAAAADLRQTMISVEGPSLRIRVSARSNG